MRKLLVILTMVLFSACGQYQKIPQHKWNVGVIDCEGQVVVSFIATERPIVRNNRIVFNDDKDGQLIVMQNVPIVMSERDD